MAFFVSHAPVFPTYSLSVWVLSLALLETVVVVAVIANVCTPRHRNLAATRCHQCLVRYSTPPRSLLNQSASAVLHSVSYFHGTLGYLVLCRNTCVMYYV